VKSEVFQTFAGSEADLYSWITARIEPLRGSYGCDV
jgi:hypothetical protein